MRMSDDSALGTPEHHALFFIRVLYVVCFHVKSRGDGSTMTPCEPFPSAEHGMVMSDAFAKSLVTIEKNWVASLKSIARKRAEKGRDYRHTAGDWRRIERVRAFLQLWLLEADEVLEVDPATQCQYWKHHAGGDPYELASQAPRQHLLQVSFLYLLFFCSHNPHKKSICTPCSDVCSSEGLPLSWHVCKCSSVSDGEAKLALSDARRRRAGQSAVDHGLNLDHLLGNLKYAVKMSFQQPRLGALVRQLQLYTCRLLESRGSGIVHVLALKPGSTTLIKLGAPQWPDCVCSSGRVMTYTDSFPDGTCLIAVRCVVLCAKQRQAMVLEGCVHQHCIQQGFAKANFTCGPKTRETYAEKERDRIVKALSDTSRCNPAQLEQRFQRDKAKGKVSEVNRDPALCVSPDPLPQGRLRSMRRAKTR